MAIIPRHFFTASFCAWLSVLITELTAIGQHGLLEAGKRRMHGARPDLAEPSDLVSDTRVDDRRDFFLYDLA